jgi:hypothetical protein
MAQCAPTFSRCETAFLGLGVFVLACLLWIIGVCVWRMAATFCACKRARRPPLPQ